MRSLLVPLGVLLWTSDARLPGFDRMVESARNPKTSSAVATAAAVGPTAEVVPTVEAALIQQAPSLAPNVLELALEAHANAVRLGLLPNPNLLTVIDYSLPSVEPRFWVFDLAARRLVFEELVAHGKNSGENLARQFSNVESSLETSLGLFVTRDVYVGKHGRSLRLEGLEPGFNDHAAARAIVIHGADYVSESFAAARGRLGRSWGCPALSRDAAPLVIDRIRQGSAVFAYYPDQRWIQSSQFLRPTDALAADAPAALPTTTDRATAFVGSSFATLVSGTAPGDWSVLDWVQQLG